MTADKLNHALALSAASESEDTLKFASPDEAQRVLEAFQKNWRRFVFPWVELVLHGSEIRMTPPDDASIQFLALAAFRTLHGDVWPYEQPLQEEDDDDEE